MQNQFSDMTLLYVEDDEMIRKQAIMYLGKFCKKIWGAKDGLEALGIYEDYRPDLIISDIKMPRLNGLDMAKKIRRRDKKTPIILATAFTDTAYLMQAVELQLVKYLVKPVTSDKLHEALNLAYAYLHEDESNIVQIGQDTIYDSLNQTLMIRHEMVKLTRNERLLLALLAKHPGHTVSYEEIEHKIWLDKGMSMDNLRSLVKLLRKKIPTVEIENISGMGYRLTH